MMFRKKPPKISPDVVFAPAPAEEVVIGAPAPAEAAAYLCSSCQQSRACTVWARQADMRALFDR